MQSLPQMKMSRSVFSGSTAEFYKTKGTTQDGPNNTEVAPALTGQVPNSLARQILYKFSTNQNIFNKILVNFILNFRPQVPFSWKKKPEYFTTLSQNLHCTKFVGENPRWPEVRRSVRTSEWSPSRSEEDATLLRYLIL